tara:strand:- start:207 stop:470 length:264 start_codon:yes stop_codon:yes gene_type:complete
MFEYEQQIDKDQLKGEDEDEDESSKYPDVEIQPVDDRYTYVGDFYKRLFPIKHIALPVDLDDDTDDLDDDTDSDWDVVGEEEGQPEM